MAIRAWAAPPCPRVESSSPVRRPPPRAATPRAGATPSPTPSRGGFDETHTERRRAPLAGRGRRGAGHRLSADRGRHGAGRCGPQWRRSHGALHQLRGRGRNAGRRGHRRVVDRGADHPVLECRGGGIRTCLCTARRARTERAVDEQHRPTDQRHQRPPQHAGLHLWRRHHGDARPAGRQRIPSGVERQLEAELVLRGQQPLQRQRPESGQRQPPHVLRRVAHVRHGHTDRARQHLRAEEERVEHRGVLLHRRHRRGESAGATGPAGQLHLHHQLRWRRQQRPDERLRRQRCGGQHGGDPELHQPGPVPGPDVVDSGRHVLPEGHDRPAGPGHHHRRRRRVVQHHLPRCAAAEQHSAGRAVQPHVDHRAEPPPGHQLDQPGDGRRRRRCHGHHGYELGRQQHLEPARRVRLLGVGDRRPGRELPPHRDLGRRHQPEQRVPEQLRRQQPDRDQQLRAGHR